MLYEDILELQNLPDVDAEIEVPEEVLEGPQTGEEMGISNLLLDAISDKANTIQKFNIMSVNCTDAEILESIKEILIDENRNLGKLQSMLRIVSPNAEEIMNGAVEEDELSTPVIESVLREKKNGPQIVDLYDQIYDELEGGYDDPGRPHRHFLTKLRKNYPKGLYKYSDIGVNGNNIVISLPDNADKNFDKEKYFKLAKDVANYYDLEVKKRQDGSLELIIPEGETYDQKWLKQEVKESLKKTYQRVK